MLEEGVWGRNLLKVSPRLARGSDPIDSIRLNNLVEATPTPTSQQSHSAPGIIGKIQICTTSWLSPRSR
jgi:hypothetical protein